MQTHTDKTQFGEIYKQLFKMHPSDAYIFQISHNSQNLKKDKENIC